MPWDGDPATFEPLTVLPASLLNTEVRDRMVTLRAGGFALVDQVAGDLMTALNATQWVRLTRAELLEDHETRIAALEEGGTGVTVTRVDINVSIDGAEFADVAIAPALANHLQAVPLPQIGRPDVLTVEIINNETLRITNLSEFTMTPNGTVYIVEYA